MPSDDASLRDEERWWIEAFAESYRRKLGLDDETEADEIHQAVPRAKGSHNIYQILQDLAALQSEYDDRTDWRANDLAKRAYRLLFPILGRTGSMMILFSASRVNSSLHPLIRVEHRKKKMNRLPSEIAGNSTSARERRFEIIGRAVVKAYRECGNLEDAMACVSEAGNIDGLPTGGFENVRANYRGFRKMAFERRYADDRALWCAVEQVPWPDDQIWLDEFPATPRG